jgi:hypothetical protein
MAPDHLASDRRLHLRERFRFTFGVQAADNLVESGFGEKPGGTQQNTIAGLFGGGFGARYPDFGSMYFFGQLQLPNPTKNTPTSTRPRPANFCFVSGSLKTSRAQNIAHT